MRRTFKRIVIVVTTTHYTIGWEAGPAQPAPDEVPERLLPLNPPGVDEGPLLKETDTPNPAPDPSEPNPDRSDPSLLPGDLS
jgi:hypothetical protein